VAARDDAKSGTTIRASPENSHDSSAPTCHPRTPWVKGIAYAAAYRFYDGDADRSEPDPKPDQWDRYMAGLWPDLLKRFSAIPAAGDAVDRNTLALAVYRMAKRVLRWLEEIGIRYVVEMQGEARQRSCWWSVAEPI
jgi:hypothetical protein